MAQRSASSRSSARRGDSASSSWLIARPRLEKRLDDVFGKRLTAVVAGAGFGKSTLLRSWSADVECAWYAASPLDASLSGFGRGLAQALSARVDPIAELVPDLGGSLEAETLASSICEAIATSISHDLVLVVDDVHELGGDGPSLGLLASLCQQAPANLHVVLASRSALSFPVARMRARGELLELEAGALAFSADEIRELVEAQSQDLDPALTDEIYEATNGWPAAVRLTLEALAAVPTAERGMALRGVRAAKGSLFSYLAEEVFARENQSVRELLRRLAPLRRLRAGLPEALGLSDAAGSLEPLAARGLLVRADHVEDGWYELHDLVRLFVLEQWALDDDELRSVHRSAAGWLGANGFPVDALQSAIEIDDHESTGDLVERHGDALLRSGHHQVLRDAGSRLPPRFRDAPVELLIGRAHHAAGEDDRARECFERAAGDERELSPELARWLGEVSIGHADYPGAIAVYDRASLDGENTAEEAILLASRAWAHSALAQREHALRYAERALAAATRAGDDAALAHARHELGVVAYLDGRLDEGDRQTFAALRAAERAGDIDQACRSRANLVEALIERGGYVAALPDASEVIRHIELHGPLGGLPDALSRRGTILLRLGKLDEALADCSLAISKTPPGEVWRLPPLIGLADVYLERGEVALARSAYEQAVALAEPMEAHQFVRPALNGLARVLAFAEPEEALRHSERALAVGTASQAETLLAAGWVAAASGDTGRAASFAVDAARWSREQSRRSGLAEALELMAVSGERDAQATRIQEALAIWEELESPIGVARCEVALARLSSRRDARAVIDQAERRLRKLGVRSFAGGVGLLAFVSPPTQAPVVVETLGGLRVLRDGELVPREAWQSRKARDLLKLLATHRGRPLAREAAMEELWPGEDPSRLANRLSVALSTLRSVLDPTHRFASEHFLRADRDALWLDLSSLELDIESFLREAARGLELARERRAAEARSLLEYAEELYAGDFLEDDRYLDWAVPLREEARGAYIAVAYALAEVALAEGAHEEALRYVRRVLERDAYDERAHLLLSSTLAAAGQHGEARRAYRVYCDRMDELGLEASPFPPLRQT